MRERFWERFPLHELTHEEWEAVCDGCGRCCLVKLEDEDTGEVVYTRVACKLLDLKTGHCSDYSNRFAHVPDCLQLSMDNLTQLKWLPLSCGYRRLHEGRGLESWHPLVSGDFNSVKQAGISVAGRVLPESAVDPDDLEDHVVRWIH